MPIQCVAFSINITLLLFSSFDFFFLHRPALSFANPFQFWLRSVCLSIGTPIVCGTWLSIVHWIEIWFVNKTVIISNNVDVVKTIANFRYKTNDYKGREAEKEREQMMRLIKTEIIKNRRIIHPTHVILGFTTTLFLITIFICWILWGENISPFTHNINRMRKHKKQEIDQDMRW